MIRFFGITICILSMGCGIDNEYIKARDWQSASGYRLGEGGDFIWFSDGDSTLKLSNDTFYFSDKPVGIVIKLDKFWSNMTVTSMDGTKKGEYTDMENLLK